jgi:hypothetical protein
MESEELEQLFRTAVNLAFYSGLGKWMDSVRTRAFHSGDYAAMDEYVDRAAPALSVLVLGESISIGVNVAYFLQKSTPGSEAYEFFDLALDGFYVDGESTLQGTAELPQWAERAGSSAQAVTDPELASQYSGIWLGMLPEFDGYFRTIAYETLSGLQGALGLTEEQLQAYYEVYENPYVLHLGRSLDTFLEGGTEGLFDGGELLGSLARYREYIEDRLVVLSVNPSSMGGRTISVISPAEPDKVFSAWIYRLHNGEYQLRGFDVNRAFTDDDIRDITLRYSGFLADTLHCIR